MKQNLKKLFTKRQGKLIMVCNYGFKENLLPSPSQEAICHTARAQWSCIPSLMWGMACRAADGNLGMTFLWCSGDCYPHCVHKAKFKCALPGVCCAQPWGATAESASWPAADAGEVMQSSENALGGKGPWRGSYSSHLPWGRDAPLCPRLFCACVLCRVHKEILGTRFLIGTPCIDQQRRVQ